MRVNVLERDVKRAVKGVLDKIQERGRARTFPYNPYYGEAGWPDRVGLVPVTITQGMVGHRIAAWIGIEVKRPGRKLSDVQRARRKEVKKYGGIWVTVKSSRDTRRWATMLARWYVDHGGQITKEEQSSWQSQSRKK